MEETRAREFGIYKESVEGPWKERKEGVNRD